MLHTALDFAISVLLVSLLTACSMSMVPFVKHFLSMIRCGHWSAIFPLSFLVIADTILWVMGIIALIGTWGAHYHG